ncbi:hypothetical protein P280DRAFT_72911 [Massarina eburnea CBS 473.64]|uniref:Uncharacterized protein n=1 Tax=Massarina eburnea CBS 473.64 TaxID=1395130 RepID=A0A6A6RUX6_9PLEO|nr:hypothetical protein P280DRAFT_72911 [Massarina eburnea CBS 473.64]
MEYSGLYYISNPSAQLPSSEAISSTLITRLEATFPHATRDESANWTLWHRLLRDIPPRAPSSTSTAEPYAHSYQHLMRLSYLNASRAYNYVQPASGADVTTSIPAEEFESHYNLLLNQWSQLWSPQRALDVVNGSTYTLGGAVTIHIGEVRSRRSGPQQGGVLSPGVVVCITTTASSSSESSDHAHVMDLGEGIGFEDVQERVTHVWKEMRKGADLGKGEVKEVLQLTKDVGGENETEREAVVRMWCEALKLRG